MSKNMQEQLNNYAEEMGTSIPLDLNLLIDSHRYLRAENFKTVEQRHKEMNHLRENFEQMRSEQSKQEAAIVEMLFPEEDVASVYQRLVNQPKK